ncbi:MAG TPA: MoaD/ThiS family protein [Thermoanaerobaculia bacterium]|nr:MoaD/ThiS family protein [Thermoanaerobaculia bacterium]
MATFNLPTTLRPLAGGMDQVEAAGATVGEALRELERAHPRLAGWVLDERGGLRPHVSLFVNDQLAAPESPIAPGDEVHIVPAISGGVGGRGGGGEGGGRPAKVEILAGTRKGLFVLRGPRGGPLAVAARRFAGQPVEYAMRDPRTGSCFASVTHSHFGPHLFIAPDPAAADDSWEQAAGPAFPADTGATVQRIWVVEPGSEEGELWAGVAPAALFRSGDGGRSWELVRGLWDEPSRPDWQPGAGGLCLHSICPWPGEPARLAVGISSAGVWVTEDGGKSWRRGTSGLVARYVPEEARAASLSFCIHKLLRTQREPATLYLQFHGGVYRSDDAGLTWNDVGTGTGLPSDFGFPLVLDPQDPARAFVIPLVADADRVTPEGRLRVYETRDRGASWRALTAGLPQENSYLTVLRQAFGHDGGDPLGLYFGAESGDLYASPDGGQTWSTALAGLPPILSVHAHIPG